MLETISTCYNGNTSSCNTTAITLPITQITAVTTLGSMESKTNTDYNSYSLPTEVDQYGFGSGAPGGLVRKRLITYDTALYGKYIYDRPSEIQTEDSSSTVRAQATYGYDGNGNLQSEAHTNTGGSPSSINRSFTHNTNGTLATATDFNSSTHITSYTYGSGSCNDAFPITVSVPTSLSLSIAWNCYGAVPTKITDANGQPTIFDYADPNNFWRVTEIVYPDQGNTTISYTDTNGGPFTVATSRLVSSGVNHQVTQSLDGLGRVVKSVDSQACNSASSSVVTSYDSLGRVYTVSNPYCTTSDPTYGLTTYGYDPLNRITGVEAPDGSTTSTTYSANCATATDPASKKRTLCADALGRITSATEDPSGLDYSTTYTYDTLDDLTGVTQSSQTRTYAYDMLARLTSAKTPEVNVAGAQCSTTYGYDANGNLTSKVAPLANQITSCTNTATTTYAYDALNRLTSKTYSDGTPPATFSYDQTSVTLGSWSSPTLTYPKGRLTEATTTVSGSVNTAVVYSYDPMGRTQNFWQCNPSNCGSASIYEPQYYYDLAGDISSWAHPGLFTLNQHREPGAADYGDTKLLAGLQPSPVPGAKYQLHCLGGD